MIVRFPATRVATGLVISAALVLAAHQIWSGTLAPAAWVLLGMISAFSLSGSV
ncbi:MAG TPA: hypothetical protein VFG33_36235 [Kribbella sp.]|uniref:hypothetical protein n=1 Tax=Kribbella sp. TaxID=1871183 RepID=UPI002D790CFE|nr:hypothetical protein [Kribbella sp.]HET6298875.1 hypothetical protein [Kribbella sp.]